MPVSRPCTTIYSLPVVHFATFLQFICENILRYELRFAIIRLSQVTPPSSGNVTSSGLGLQLWPFFHHQGQVANETNAGRRKL